MHWICLQWLCFYKLAMRWVWWVCLCCEQDLCTALWSIWLAAAMTYPGDRIFQCHLHSLFLPDICLHASWLQSLCTGSIYPCLSMVQLCEPTHIISFVTASQNAPHLRKNQGLFCKGIITHYIESSHVRKSCLHNYPSLLFWFCLTLGKHENNIFYVCIL